MKRTRLGITAALLGSAMLGSASAGGWREAFPLPASAAGCDLARGFATAALLAPASRPRRLSAGDAETAAAMNGIGASPFVSARHGNLGAGAVLSPVMDLNGPQTSFSRQAAPER
jgi:hypothetical protein